MIVRRPSSQFTTSSKASDCSSSTSSLYPASVLDEKDTDDESIIMSVDDYVPSRPLSVAIPKTASIASGPYCIRRPNLREILSNTSQPPWTLAAFMAYLSSNHCLETLEFTMDAGRYKKHYAKMLTRATDGGPPPAKDREYVVQLWHRLIDAYIQPNGSREVNLPSEVRDPILNLSASTMPPAPETLDPAVAKIYELMEDSVLVPFLNSVYPQQSSYPSVASCPLTTSDDSVPSSPKSIDSRTSKHQKQARNSPPPQKVVEPHAHSYSHPTFMNRKSAPSTFTQASSNKSRSAATGAKLQQSTSQPNQHGRKSNHSTSRSLAAIADNTASGSDLQLSGSNSTSNGAPGMTTDDSNSTDSPRHDSPMTPPISPPLSDVGSPPAGNSISSSPRTSRDSGMWRKLGRLSGMKGMTRKKSQGGLQTSTEQ